MTTQLETALNNAIAVLKTRLRCKHLDAKTHRVVAVEGWADDVDTVNAVAVYLVGLLANAISRALSVRAGIENTAEDRLELVRNVEKIAGSGARPLSVSQQQDERNPWIAEGIWHLCLVLTSGRPELHPHGAIIAVDLPHVAAKDHGFDVIGIFKSASEVGVTFVESKAYERDPNGAINSAVSFYKDLEAGKHDSRARQVIQTLREALPASEQGQVSLSLWKHRRAYVPNPHYDAAISIDWTHARPSFGGLGVGRQDIVVMPNCLPAFRAFFDAVADAMLRFAQGLPHV